MRYFAACVALSALIGPIAEAQTPRVIRDDPDGHYRYFHDQRAFPFDSIPKGAFGKARRQLESQWPRHRLSLGQAVGNGWTSIGPNNVQTYGPSSGRLSAIAVHPTIPTTIYAGGAQGGVWKTVNGGANWTPLTDDQCSLAMGTIAIDPVNPEIVYAGTGETHGSVDSYYGCGVLRTTDGGITWEKFGSEYFDEGYTFGSGAKMSSIVIDPFSAGSASTTTVFVGTNIGLFKSTNSGVTWTPVTNGLPIFTGTISSMITDMVADNSTPGTFYVGVPTTAPGVYKTTDYGATWTKVASHPSTGGRVHLAISRSSPRTLYFSASNGNTGTLGGIFRTNDGGVTWVQLPATNAACYSQCWYDQHIQVDPTNPEIVYFGGFSLYKSTNGGQTFANVGGSIHPDQHAMAFDPVNPAIIYAGNDGGIFRSADAGATWTSLNTDISIHQFYPGFSMHPTNPDWMMGGSQDNGTNEYHGTPSWLPVGGGDGGFTAIDHVTGNTAWQEIQWGAGAGNGGGPSRRLGSSGGFSWKRSGIDLNDRAEFIPPLVMDPVNPQVLYFGTYRLYRTRDNGENWQAVSGDFSNGGFVSAIEVSRTDTNQIYVGYNNGRVATSRDGAVSFTVGSGLPQRYVRDIAADPFDPNIAYATVSGFQSGHVWKTVDRGMTWTNISGNLPDIPVNAIVIIPGLEIDIGTDLGVFRSTDGGSSWSPFPGLPNVAVYDLVFNRRTRLLVAATHGRGAFKYSVPAVTVLRGDVTNDLSVGALDAQAVLSATVGLGLPEGWSKDTRTADANCDGSAPTAVDAQVILSFVVGLPVPPGACVGKYQ